MSDTEASFSDFHIYIYIYIYGTYIYIHISDGFVKTKIYDKRDDFDFDIVNFHI